MSDTDQPLLQSENLSVSVPGRMLVEGLDLTLRRGELLAVLGQNGTGKTLALTTLAGLRTAHTGQVRLLGNDIAAMPRQSTARHLVLLPQVTDDIFPATVMDTALIGRHPHIGRFRWESAADRTIAAQSLATMGMLELQERDILTLSGGERRRLAIAQVLTQAPDVYLLDEPTNHLDPQHQLDALRVFRRAADGGAGIIASLHDVNLAVRFADRCLLLFGDGRWQLGNCSEILTEQTLSELFATRMEAVQWRSHELFVASSGNPAL
jgi:iron complex transport system ATP-binding protein